jgi:hypothetical protein
MPSALVRSGANAGGVQQRKDDCDRRWARGSRRERRPFIYRSRVELVTQMIRRRDLCGKKKKTILPDRFYRRCSPKKAFLFGA